jgi:hypothetical protein
MVAEGLDLMSNADIARWMRRVPKAIAARTGAAVVCLDHLPKNRENHGRFALGGQHKLAGVTGASYRFEAVTPFGRAVTEEVTGQVRIVVTKDRPGHVRTIANADGVVATMELTSYPDGAVRARFTAGDTDATPDLSLVFKVLEYVAMYPGATKRAIHDEVTGKATAVARATQYAVAQKWLAVTRVGQAHRHDLTDAGRAELDR